MQLDDNIPELIDWILPALIQFISAICVVSLIGCTVGFIAAASRRGPVEGFYSVAKVIASAVIDLSRFSLRRTLAMSMLAVQESIRRRVLIAFAIFIVVMLFAGWYLDVRSDNPARLYLSFVLTASNYLVLILALFLSTFSLPADIKSRTIYTIVTKPVRSFEIVLGRIIGFSVVGSILLVGMCFLSYLFVVRGLNHSHAVDEMTPAAAAVVEDDAAVVSSGRTTQDGHHRHTVQVFGDGHAESSLAMGHRHVIDAADGGSQEVGPMVDMLQARVPHYGAIRFLTRAGQPGDGINVGSESAYRSYIAGGTLSAAIWTFDYVTPDRYPEGIDLELTIRVFRTHMGNIEEGILGTLTVKNPNPTSTLQSEPITFRAKEFVSDRISIPRSLKGIDSITGEVRDVDLFEDLADNGRIELVMQCSDAGQYFGMAAADVYILDADGQFLANFAKGYIGIWLQMVLVNTFGVAFSTFLSGAVAMLATLSTIVIGLFRQFIVELFRGELQGGGPLESTIRVIKQVNLSVNLEIGSIPLAIVKGTDVVFLWFLRTLAVMMPDYTRYSTADYVAYGYNIPGTLLITHLLNVLGFLIIVSTVGYFFMKTREVAA